jgi:hypothetical protein
MSTIEEEVTIEFPNWSRSGRAQSLNYILFVVARKALMLI